jgi:hypothetical protein
MLKMKELISILSQLASLLLCFVNCCSYLKCLMAFVLVMLCQKHISMLLMKLRSVHACRKLTSKILKLHFRRQSPRLRSFWEGWN